MREHRYYNIPAVNLYSMHRSASDDDVKEGTWCVVPVWHAMTELDQAASALGRPHWQGSDDDAACSKLRSKLCSYPEAILTPPHPRVRRYV
jgi:hypothetical protein